MRLPPCDTAVEEVPGCVEKGVDLWRGWRPSGSGSCGLGGSPHVHVTQLLAHLFQEYLRHVSVESIILGSHTFSTKQHQSVLRSMRHSYSKCVRCVESMILYESSNVCI